MGDISLIDTSNYKCYYSIDGIEDFKLYTPTPSGNIEYTEYDTFTSVDKTIIAFKELDPYSGDFNYVLIYNDEESIIDAVCYEDILEHIAKDNHKEEDMYCVMSSKVMTPAAASKDAVNFIHRCDAGKYGPVQFPLEDGVSPTVTDTALFQHITKISVMIGAGGVAHIVYGAVPKLNDSFRDWPAVTGVAKTLMGVMKLIIEWASLTESPFNSDDEVALTCKTYIDTLKIPADVLNEISEYQEDMPVYRYFQNQENARRGFDEQTNISPLFLNWVKSTHRYRTLSALVHNHPSPPVVPEEILLLEKQNIESKIYGICIKHGVDFSLSPLEMLEKIPPFTDLTLGQWILEVNYLKSYISYS
jgi:hypothetical protein